MGKMIVSESKTKDGTEVDLLLDAQEEQQFQGFGPNVGLSIRHMIAAAIKKTPPSAFSFQEGHFTS